jgi:site-specific DNA-methyltransferase (adenine-specific)
MNIQYIDINKLKPYARNPRKNDRAVDAVANSIEQYGFQQPIVVDSAMTIIVGHTRFRAAKKLELAQVPVVIADTLTEQQAQAYRIMDNRSNENAQWDNQLLLDELGQLLDTLSKQETSYRTGFTESELNKLFKTDDDLLNEIANKLTPITYSRPGDIWTLNNHKIMNGSSTNAFDLAQLLNNERIDLVWEDPPYGVKYETANGINHSKEYNELNNHKIANDALTPEQLDQFLEDHISILVPYMKAGAPIYWCHDIRFNHQFKTVLENNSIHIADTLIWRKNNASTWLTDYAKYYEPILYGWKTGAEHPWYGKGMQPNAYTLDDLKTKTNEQLIKIIQDQDTNYQEFKKEPRKIASLHPTVKPVKLIEYHIINSTRRENLVFDGFSGSGSTLLACQMTDRSARCMELESKFVDVTIRRWQEMTGLEAQRQDGVKWNELVEATPNQDDINTNLSTFFNIE